MKLNYNKIYLREMAEHVKGKGRSNLQAQGERINIENCSKTIMCHPFQAKNYFSLLFYQKINVNYFVNYC